MQHKRASAQGETSQVKIPWGFSTYSTQNWDPAPKQPKAGCPEEGVRCFGPSTEDNISITVIILLQHVVGIAASPPPHCCY